MRIDLNSAEYDRMFAAAPLYRKNALVSARPAVPGEEIVTVMADGREETRKTAGEDEWVITNPSGEQYITSAAKFAVRYEAEGDRYRAKGIIAAFPNPTGAEISITAPWGEEQNQGPDCWLAATLADGKPSADRYLIGGPEFAETYERY